MRRRRVSARKPDASPKPRVLTDAENAPDWKGKCEACGASPTHRMTGMCGPCTFGEAETVGGNW